ncbi:MAG: hypothetical protein HYZ63_00290 [Candidatus Andersenbacteria bacterium]|nr:hypothetical protein [Candidatus Andersenbacteria bacterium]
MMLEAELKKAGLSDKQAQVYLALLQLGPSPIQKIARKAGVARATTYVVIESLEEMGLVEAISQENRLVYIAESPQRLLQIVVRKQQLIEESRRDLEQLVPALQAIFHRGNDEPSVRYYPGKAGLIELRQEMTRLSSQGDVWFNLAPSDKLKAVFGEKDYWCRTRVAKGIKSKTIFTTNSQATKEQLLRTSNQHLMQRRFIAPDDLAITSGLTVFQDKVAVGLFNQNAGGLIIQSESLAGTLAQFFGLIWKKLE